MTRKEKLLEKARNNPSGLSFVDFVTLMKQSGWVLDHQTGSHQIWYANLGKNIAITHRISVQNRNNKAKGYQVKQFLSALDEV